MMHYLMLLLPVCGLSVNHECNSSCFTHQVLARATQLTGMLCQWLVAEDSRRWDNRKQVKACWGKDKQGPSLWHLQGNRGGLKNTLKMNGQQGSSEQA